jgi:hypothetical protein
MYKRLAAFSLSATVVFLCAVVVFFSILLGAGVNIHHPKYYESKGPFTYTFGDWLREMWWFFAVQFSPFIIGATATVFVLYWLVGRSETKTRSTALKSARRAAVVAFLVVSGAGLIGGIIMYSYADEKLDRLNTEGPPQ